MAVPAPSPGRLIDIGGFNLHLNVTGSGPVTVVLESALGASSLAWSLVQPQLTSIARVCSYDRAGFGWSDPGPSPRTARRMADELRRLLDRAAVPPPFIIVGHSFGGLIAAIFARRFHADVRGMVLVDPAHPADWIHPSDTDRLKITRGLRLCRIAGAAVRFGVVRAAVGPMAFGLARGLTAIIRRGHLWQEGDGALAPLEKLPPDARAQVLKFWTQPKFFEALGQQIGSMPASALEARDAFADDFGDLPLVTISSRYADPSRRQQQDALARRSSRGRHVVAPNSGHWMPLEEPEVVVAAVRDVLSMVSRD